MKALIKKLVEAYGPSGSEAEVRALVRSEVADLADSVSVDALGNLIAVVKKKSGTGKKVMLSAHMDEIGFVATHIDERGFVRFQVLGGINPLACVGARVRFGGGQPGTIGVEARREDQGKVPGWHELYIDLGVASRADCPIRVGDAAAFYQPMVDMGERLMAKSMDDRVGVAILLEVLRRLKRTPHEVAFVFSVQEEVGIRGAGVAAYGLDVDFGLAVDVTRTGDTPKSVRMEVSLGGGAAIKVRDSGMIADTRVKELLVARGREAGIRTQLEVLEGGTTDASAMQIARAGLPVGAVSVPTRYIHTPSELVHYADVEACVGLLLATLQKPVDL
jgi:tetrahedral aminopeptidase